DLHYYDVALRYIALLERKPNLVRRAQSDLFSLKIDCFKALGDTATVTKLSEDFKRLFPEHARSSLGNLEQIGAALEKVVEVYDRAAIQSDKKKAAAQREQGAKLFLDEVEKPLEALIVDLQKKCEPPKPVEGKPRQKSKG